LALDPLERYFTNLSIGFFEDLVPLGIHSGQFSRVCRRINTEGGVNISDFKTLKGIQIRQLIAISSPEKDFQSSGQIASDIRISSDQQRLPVDGEDEFFGFGFGPNQERLSGLEVERIANQNPSPFINGRLIWGHLAKPGECHLTGE
jgi:hypothetical protein